MRVWRQDKSVSGDRRPGSGRCGDTVLCTVPERRGVVPLAGAAELSPDTVSGPYR